MALEFWGHYNIQQTIQRILEEKWVNATCINFIQKIIFTALAHHHHCAMNVIMKMSRLENL